MFKYTIKNYKQEMASYYDKLPSTWVNSVLESGKYSNLSNKEKVRLKQSLRNTLSGLNFKNGIKNGYINDIRKVYSKFNGIEYVELPSEVVIF